MLKIYDESENALIEACIKGKGRAQKALYDKYSDLMYGVCIRYVKDPEVAEDVLITSFTKIFEKIGMFKFEGSFEGWIRRIMVNESLTYLRKNKNMHLSVDIEMADREPDYNTIDGHLESEDLLKLVQTLPDGYRTVLNLYAIEGYNHKEIGEKLEISENTSKSQLSRARVMLKNRLVEAERIREDKIKRS